MLNDYDIKNQIATISLFGSDKSTLPQDRISMNDINSELGRIEKKLYSDRIRHNVPQTDNPALVRETSVLFSPALQGENDYLNSRATNTRKKWMPKEEYKEIQKHYEKVKKDFDGKYKIECEKEAKIRDGKFVLVPTGDVIVI
jgi:hypothetical protein